MRWNSILALATLAAACAEQTPRPEPQAGGEPAPSQMPPASDVSALALEAAVAELGSYPVQLRGTLRVTNPTDGTIQFDVGGCPVFLRIYDAEGTAVWDQGDGAICTMILRTVTLAPGATESFQTGTASATDILGDQLPDGTYRVAVYLALVEGGKPEASAGEVELAIPR